MQICDAEDATILKGVVSKDHVHMQEYRPSTTANYLVKKLKGRSSKAPTRIPVLKQKYWEDTFGG